MDKILNGLEMDRLSIFHCLCLLNQDQDLELEYLLDLRFESFGMHYIKN